jgi:hypothetical protein
MGPTQKTSGPLFVEALEDRFLLTALPTIGQLASLVCPSEISVIALAGDARESARTDSPADRDSNLRPSLSSFASAPDRDTTYSRHPASLFVGVPAAYPTGSPSFGAFGREDNDGDGSLRPTLLLLGEAALSLVFAQRSAPICPCLAEAGPVAISPLQEKPPVPPAPGTPPLLAGPPAPSPALLVGHPVPDDSTGPPPSTTTAKEVGVHSSPQAGDQPAELPSDTAGPNSFLPSPEAGTPLAGIFLPDLRKIEEGVDQFFAELTAMGNPPPVRRTLTLTVWLALTTVAAGELVRARLRRSGRDLEGAALPGGPGFQGGEAP